MQSWGKTSSDDDVKADIFQRCKASCWGKQSEAAWPDYRSDARRRCSVCAMPDSLLSFNFFVFLRSPRNSPFTFQAPLQSARLPCWQLPGHINRIPEARSTERQKSERESEGENRMISFGKRRMCLGLTCAQVAARRQEEVCQKFRAGSASENPLE